MVTNMGGLDRALRFVIALLIGSLWIGGVIHGALAWIFGVIALAFLATSVIGWCPLYVPFGRRTRSGTHRPV